MRFVSYRDRFNEDVRQGFLRAVEDTVGEARANAPVSMTAGAGLNVGNVQGGLRASVTSREVDTGGDEMSALVGSGVRHAAQREFGGPIVPVRARLLSWVDPVTGERRFARRVYQRPGGRSNGYKPWLRPAGERFPEYMGQHLRRGRFGT